MTLDDALTILSPDTPKPDLMSTAARTTGSIPSAYTEAIQVALECIKRCRDFEEIRDKHAQLHALADVLDGCPLTQPCDEMWAPHGWCEEHCAEGQDLPDKECWLRYAEIVANGEKE